MTESSVFQLESDPRSLLDWVKECLASTGERLLTIEWIYSCEDEDGAYCMVDTEGQTFILGEKEVVVWDPEQELFLVPDSEHQPVKHHQASSLRKAQGIVDFYDELEEVAIVDLSSFIFGKAH